MSKSQFKLVKKENDFLRIMDHPGIVIYYTTIEDEKNFHIIMENLSGLDLGKLLKNNLHKVSPESFKYILFQILCAINYIHHKGIIHKDIKMENIILINNDKQYDVKIIDFGLSEEINNQSSHISGSPNYMSPEAIDGKNVPANDIWSVGVICYFYCFGKMPFFSEDYQNLFDLIKKSEIDFKTNKKIDKSLIDLTQKMLIKDYTKRISTYDALMHETFNDLNKDFDKDSIKQMLDEFFTENTLNLIKNYVYSNIIKKTFLYLYTLLIPFEKKNKYRKLFMSLDFYFNDYKGVLQTKLIFEEFLKRGLCTEFDSDLFSFIDNSKSNRVKSFFREKNIDITSISFKEIQKRYSKSISLRRMSTDDMGIIQYTVFLSFFFFDKVTNKKNKEKFQSKLLYGFKLLSDKDEFIENNEDDEEIINSYFINKTTFMNFLDKHNCPFKDALDEINSFFKENPNEISYEQFKEFISM
jgi:serine/threonine protein kinase